MPDPTAHAVVADRTQLGQRFQTCACGHSTSGTTADTIAQQNMATHLRRAREDAAITEFRGACVAVRNSAVMLLCSSALTGDPEARTRVLAIMDGHPDPGSVASRARCAQLREAHGLPAGEG